MKIVIKPGINKVKVTYEGIFDNYSNENLLKVMASIYKNTNNPYANMFLSPDLDYFKNTYGKAVTNVINNYKDTKQKKH